MIAPALADNIVRKQLGPLIADAEALLGSAAWPDLPCGLRIVNCAAGRIAGFSLGSGHRLAQAHGHRPGAVAVAVAAEVALQEALAVWADEPAAALGEAGVVIELVAVHELAHAVTNDIDGELQPRDAELLRRLPLAAGRLPGTDTAERTARDHGAAWAAAVAILGRRCSHYRPGARHRWRELLDRDLRAYGIAPEAVADVVGDVADEGSLRELLAPGAAIVERVADAIPDEAARAALIAHRRNETTPAEPGHVAPVAAGVGIEEASSWRSTSSE